MTVLDDAAPAEVDAPAPEPAADEVAPAPEPPAPAPAVTEEELSLLPDGRIRLAFQGKRYLLRRPRFGEFKALRQKFLDMVGLTPDQQLDHSVEWMLLAFELSDVAVTIPVEDWPAWLVGGGVQFTEWISHWREVPLAPGGPTGQ